MENIQSPDHLPESFYQYFWDVDAGKVNPNQSPEYVISRVLELGNEDAVRWVFEHFPQDEIIRSLTLTRNISFRTASFWANYFNIDRKEFKCMQEPYYSMRRTHWPY